MSCNRLYGGQKKNKQASQRKRSGGDPDGETTDGEVRGDGKNPAVQVVGGIEGVVKKVAAPADAAAPTEENQVEPASTADAPTATAATAAPTEPGAPTDTAAPTADAAPNKSFWSIFGFNPNNKGGKRRTQRKQQKQRRTQKAGSQKTVIGRLYSKTCVHCVAMEGAWKQLHKMIKQRGGNIVMKDMEAGKMGQQLPQMNKQFLGGSDQRVELQGGFPTLFKIKNSKVEYYGGERTADAMFNWALQ